MPPEKIAALDIPSSPGAGIYITRIDGERVSPYGLKRIEFLPGEHTVQVYWEISPEPRFITYALNDVILSFAAYAGHAYDISWSESHDTATFVLFITDRSTGLPVSSVTGRAPAFRNPATDF